MFRLNWFFTWTNNTAAPVVVTGGAMHRRNRATPGIGTRGR